MNQILLRPKLSLDGNTTNSGTSATGTVTISTTKPNDIIIIYSAAVGINITSISDGSGLVWNKRIGPIASGILNIELWWASSPGILTSDVITVNYSSSAGFRITAIAINGAGSLITPFDKNVSFPASTNQSSGTSATNTVSTNSANTMLLGFARAAASFTTLTRPNGFSFITSSGSAASDIGSETIFGTVSSKAIAYNWTTSASDPVEYILDAISGDNTSNAPLWLPVENIAPTPPSTDVTRFSSAMNVFPAIVVTIPVINWYPDYDSDVFPFPLSASYSYFSEQLPNPININNWIPDYAAEVNAWLKSSQFSYFSQQLAAPLSIVNYTPVYDASVKPGALSARYSYHSELLPIPAARTDWFHAYDADVKPFLTRTQFNYFSELLASPIKINNWMPDYDASVSPFLLSSQFSFYSGVVPQHIALNNFWNPKYYDQVKPWPLRANYSYYSELLKTPIPIIHWFHAYDAEVKPWPKAAQFSYFTQRHLFRILSGKLIGLRPKSRALQPDSKNAILNPKSKGRII